MYERARVCAIDRGMRWMRAASHAVPVSLFRVAEYVLPVSLFRVAEYVCN